MTEQNDAKNWTSKQSWIKDVLSKSGTELVDISKNKPKMQAHPNQTKGQAKYKAKESSTSSGSIGGNMVYYTANQLLIKTEQPSQAQFCTPLQVAASSSSTHVTPPSGQHEQYELLQTPQQRQMQLQQQQQQQQQQFAGYQLTTQQHQQQSITSGPPSASSSAAAGAQLQRIKTELPPYGGTGTMEGSAVRKPNNNGQKPQFKCEQCGMTFGSKSAHTSHTKSHAKNAADLAGGSHALGGIAASGIEVNEAGLPLGIPKSPTIKPLANVAAGADPYQCNVCQKTFAVPARLIRHYRTHTGERPFECEFCHKLFSVKENLQVHRRIHTKERPYKCDVCGRAFEHSGKLHRHMRIHTGERPHKCSVCEKTFIQSGQLVIHMRTHTGEKPYKCPVEGCGKGFTCSKQLKVHSRTHTGEKPYHCDICFRDFGYNHVLKLHRVQHYGAKCYKCTICEETFKNKKEMEAHIKGHANELPDDEADGEAAGGGAAPTQPLNSESSNSNHSPPGSPPVINSGNGNGNTNNKRKPRQPRGFAAGSPNSSRSSNYSPSSCGGSTLSSPPPPMQFPAQPSQADTDPHSRDSGVSSAQPHNLSCVDEELPTDLSMQQQSQAQPPAQQPAQQSTQQMYYQATSSHSGYNLLELQPPSASQSQTHSSSNMTINPVLLEAANMARRNHNEDNADEDVQAAAWQMMQLRRGHASSTSPTPLPKTTNDVPLVAGNGTLQPTLHVSDLDANYDDTHEANVLIEHFKRGDLARHGLHKGYAPVPKYESSLQNHDIVRRVEAAIGLRSSTESPERSSSPESDSLLMANRNVSTLPLRKRKHYMNEGDVSTNGGAAADINATAASTAGVVGVGVGVGAPVDASSTTNGTTKVMRMSSVIQFAKAS